MTPSTSSAWNPDLHRAILCCAVQTCLRILTVALAPAIIVAAIGGCTLGLGLPPAVSWTTPADGSGNAPVGSTITAAFSRPMDPATITSGSFIVQMGDTPVTGTVTCSGKSATFTPASLLPGNTLLTATITTAAKDAAGVALASPRVWTFMTTPTPTAGNMVLYYTYTFGAIPWSRSQTPVTQTNAGNTVSDTYNPADGSITLTITAAPGYEDNGFYFYVGSLQNLDTLKVVATPGSGPFSVNLYLDVDGDGEYFTWSGTLCTGFGLDQSLNYNGPPPVNGVLMIGPTSTFSGHTIPELRTGAVAGVSGSTHAAIWLGIAVSAPGLSQTTTISTVKVN